MQQQQQQQRINSGQQKFLVRVSTSWPLGSMLLPYDLSFPFPLRPSSFSFSLSLSLSLSLFLCLGQSFCLSFARSRVVFSPLILDLPIFLFTLAHLVNSIHFSLFFVVISSSLQLSSSLLLLMLHISYECSDFGFPSFLIIVLPFWGFSALHNKQNKRNIMWSRKRTKKGTKNHLKWECIKSLAVVVVVFVCVC